MEVLSLLAGILLSESMTISHLWFTKINTNGDQEWNATSKRPQGDMATSVYQTLDGGYVLAGYSGSGNNDVDALIMKTDAKGNEQWNMTFGEVGEPEGAYSVAQTEDGGYILGGFKLSRRLMGNNYDAKGKEKWKKLYDEPKKDKINTVKEVSKSVYLLAGDSESYGAGNIDAWFVKIRETNATTAADSDGFDIKSAPGFEISGTMVSIVILFLLIRKRT